MASETAVKDNVVSSIVVEETPVSSVTNEKVFIL
jgi:hypothetical protein